MANEVIGPIVPMKVKSYTCCPLFTLLYVTGYAIQMTILNVHCTG